ncbi:NDMA-dependent alcohol dehydrogenase [Epidermidibacterium keratini]|uniref:NDMA-dependent alcohol dehydrogenase n=1 Tax=Epidermidibacterium keratini TaxID=1891644 RepID=A0A7L4YLK5_9ACTN|nr:NDMA-dependent alcohol dehydrogenase [Epidermidibacterium keratini]QHB99718.1 NDMA-dependent alcohol dehydrogenase [Epidermidibacterium keratini]
MESTAAVLFSSPGEYQTATVTLDEPRQDELVIRLVASGLCHSDDHYATGDLTPKKIPFCGGHEGAGVVEQVGPHTSGFEVGDHVIMTFMPACGRCFWCSQGKQELCDTGAQAESGGRPDDPNSYRLSIDGEPCGQMTGISTFSERTLVSTRSAYKVPKDVPLKYLCLLGCGVGTGYGSAINAAEVRPGHTVIVMGMGGIGCAAVQGAAHAGAANVIVVDPLELKRELAGDFGATHAVASIEAATDLARSFTNGQGADSTIVTVGRLQPEDLTNAVESIRKGGIAALTAVGTFQPVATELNLGMLSMMQKTIRGVVFGNWSPFVSVPRLLDLYQRGQLKLDEMVTATYSIEQVAQGYRDLKDGKNLRGMVDFEA